MLDVATAGVTSLAGFRWNSLITAAAQALATGDPLGALKWVALRNDAPALRFEALRWPSSAIWFAPRLCCERRRDRCIVAEAEIALVSRDLNGPAKALDTAQAALERRGDRTNAAYAQHLKVGRLLLIGRLDEAERALAKFDATPLPPALRAAHELVIAGIAIRRLRTKTARDALGEAERAAQHAGIPALMAEAESTTLVFDVAAHAGAAYDGRHLFHLSGDSIQKIDPNTGRVLSTIPTPGGAGSGLAWAEGALWMGQYRNRKIHQIDPDTGAVLRTIESNRFVALRRAMMRKPSCLIS